jgi:hypothetical protein
MEEIALGYMICAVYFHGFFNGSDEFRIRPTWRRWLLNLAVAAVWPIGLVIMVTPARWWRRG